MVYLKTVLSRPPKRFDPYFVDILAHNLKLYSVHTEGVGGDARPLETVPQADDKANVSIFVRFFLVIIISFFFITYIINFRSYPW